MKEVIALLLLLLLRQYLDCIIGIGYYMYIL